MRRLEEGSSDQCRRRRSARSRAISSDSRGLAEHGGAEQAEVREAVRTEREGGVLVRAHPLIVQADEERGREAYEGPSAQCLLEVAGHRDEVEASDEAR